MIRIPNAGVGQPRESDRLERNPYSPPASAALEAAPSELGPRPFAVWLLLLVLCVLTLAGVVGLARFFWTVASHGFEDRNPHSPAIIAWRLAWVAVASFAMVSAYRRGRLGRWLGVAAIAVLTVWSVAGDRSRLTNCKGSATMAPTGCPMTGIEYNPQEQSARDLRKIIISFAFSAPAPATHLIGMEMDHARVRTLRNRDYRKW